MGTPGDRLYCRSVFSESPSRSRIRPTPNEQLVIVPTTSELVGIAIPPQTTDLLLVMPRQTADVLIGNAGVTMEDCTIPGAGGQDMVVPSETADTTSMTCHGPDPLAILSIPDLHRAAICSDGKCTALSKRLEIGYKQLQGFRLTLFVHSKPVMTSLTSSPLAVLVVRSHSLVTLLVCALQR